MHSVKNLLVVILLMGVSYGAYQVITAPESTAESLDTETLDIVFETPPSLGERSPRQLPTPDLAPPLPKFQPQPPSPSPESTAGIGGDLSLPDVPMPGSLDTSVPPQRDPQAFLVDNQSSPNATEGSFKESANNQSQPDLPNPPPFPNVEGTVPQPGSMMSVEAKPSPHSEPATEPVENMESPIGLATIDWNGIKGLADQGSVKEALSELSKNYDSPLTEADKQLMLRWLDSLAGRVIYSTDHCLHSQPYVVKPGDTLETIGQQWNVPGQLIYNVNANNIVDPQNLTPGTELKVIQGPFNAVINVERQEMTLFLQGMYAGRFAIELGQDGQGIEYGSFMVQEKLRGQTYQASDQVIAPGDPQNPYGQYWIGLNGNASIHESNRTGGLQDNRGSIRLASKDAADVFGILSSGSQVTIQR